VLQQFSFKEAFSSEAYWQNILGERRNRAKDFVHKLTTFIAREFEGYVHGFEDLRGSSVVRPLTTKFKNSLYF
jgi:hypothetical protein